MLTGLILAALVALGLAWVFPPLRPPDVDERALTPPGGLAIPGAVGRPEGASPEGRLPDRAAPATAPAPGPDRAP
ncbi:MAG TPA: hypothetical protein VFN28_08395 [Amaricoccus sp.]|nr:hypothetical protein [Amaricoccus sp.]